MIKRFTEQQIDAAFVNKCAEPDARGCVNWTGALKKNGYGSFSIHRVIVYAHRFAWQRANGTIPKGLNVLHSCDNPKCVNPEHLFPGTQKDNLNDARRKGRTAAGEISPHAKLTRKQVIEIRASKGKVLQSELAAKFGVARQRISAIQQGNGWKEASTNQREDRP